MKGFYTENSGNKVLLEFYMVVQKWPTTAFTKKGNKFTHIAVDVSGFQTLFNKFLMDFNSFHFYNCFQLVINFYINFIWQFFPVAIGNINKFSIRGTEIKL